MISIFYLETISSLWHRELNLSRALSRGGKDESLGQLKLLEFIGLSERRELCLLRLFQANHKSLAFFLQPCH